MSGGGYLLGKSYASYQESKSFNVMEGTFDYYQGSDVYFAFYQGNEQVSTMPRKESGYLFNSQKSNCTNDATIAWNHDQWSPIITNLTKAKTKCTLYFEQGKNLVEELLKNETGKSSVLEAKQVIEGKGTPDFSQIATTNEGMYATQDDYGTSYYYRGKVENNYVKFAGYYWRIIRANGDGSIRIIYNGDKPDQTGEHTQIQKAAFNSIKDNPGYVGYMYGNNRNVSYNQTHANEIDSNIKKVLDKWYVDNIYTKGYTSFIGDELFCNDRSITGGNGYSSTANTYYGAYKRLSQSKEPSLICPQDNDKFTTTSATVGNKKLTYPIGLITADEVSMAGAVNGQTNNMFYLYTGQWYWSMSSSIFDLTVSSAYEWGFNGDGGFSDGPWVTYGYGIRVVLNLKVGTQIIAGTGTSTDPYVVI